MLSEICIAQESKKLMVSPDRFEDVATKPPKKPRYNYSIGLQANELWRQILPLGGSTSGSNNPYLFMATINSKKTGWGLKFGGNYINTNVTDQDAANKRTSKINSSLVKMGLEKYIVLNNRFDAAFSIDGIGEYTENFTSNVLSSFDTTISNTLIKKTVAGGGPAARLIYKPSKHIQIGTEAFAYFWGTENRNDFITKVIINGGNVFESQNSSNKNGNTNFRVTLPTAIFIIINW